MKYNGIVTRVEFGSGQGSCQGWGRGLVGVGIESDGFRGGVAVLMKVGIGLGVGRTNIHTNNTY